MPKKADANKEFIDLVLKILTCSDEEFARIKGEIKGEEDKPRPALKLVVNSK